MDIIATFEPDESLGLNIEEFLVVFLSFSPNHQVRGKTRFQKLIYLLSDKFKIFKNLKFFRYYYGMYSQVLENTFYSLRRSGYLDEKIVYSDDLIYIIYRSLTAKGWAMFQEILKSNYEKTMIVNTMVQFLYTENYFQKPLKDLLGHSYKVEGWKK